ncbi:alpha/beta hydrolase [Hutsoniella sourekii]|uniref:alpha/beta hydrolase n=1 Tax=Hutsoniella sourekii TaxID=87650 RepID=UPI000486FFBF|nr:alpha/beta hydrolase [Hutsoniella sourekii]
MTSEPALANYHYLHLESPASSRLLVLLHGTGGSERDLIPIAQAMDPEASILALQGDVLEGGARRFFKRHGMGQYDLEDLNKRGQRLADFLKAFSVQEQVPLENMIPLGFSNGANMGLHLVLQGLLPLKKGIFLAPLYPLEAKPELDLSGFEALVSSGEADPIVSLEESQHVVDLIQAAGGQVTRYWVPGHEITSGLVAAGRQWLSPVNKEGA